MTTEYKNTGADKEEAGCSCGCKPSMMPKVTFSTFVLSLASSAMVQLGEAPDPDSGKNETNLVLAKHTIDILSMLESKTSASLDADEKRLIEGLLYELRMKYVAKS